MFYVYILIGKHNKKYIGYTNNLKRRMAEHNQKKVYTTRRIDNPKLVYYEAYSSETKAKLREQKLKQYGSSYQGLLKRIRINNI